MKLRNGFVSNSSSSSFIIRGEHTTADVCRMMAIDIYRDWGNNENAVALIKNLKHLPKEFDKPILIPFTTNEETFILKVDGDVYVDTCNNINWGETINHFSVFEYTDNFTNYEDADNKFNWCRYKWYDPSTMKYIMSPYCYHNIGCPNNVNTPDWLKESRK